MSLGGGERKSSLHPPGQGLALSASNTERGDPRTTKPSLLVGTDEEADMQEKAWNSCSKIVLKIKPTLTLKGGSCFGQSP